jgi:hypothetical protein
MESDLKNLDVKDKSHCSCCGAPRVEWEYCDLCRPKVCDQIGHDYVYDPHYRQHLCKNCHQKPPLEWFDTFYE